MSKEEIEKMLEELLNKLTPLTSINKGIINKDTTIHGLYNYADGVNLKELQNEQNTLNAINDYFNRHKGDVVFDSHFTHLCQYCENDNTARYIVYRISRFSKIEYLNNFIIDELIKKNNFSHSALSAHETIEAINYFVCDKFDVNTKTFQQMLRRYFQEQEKGQIVEQKGVQNVVSD